MSEDLETRIARAIYEKSPAKQPWDGDTFGFGETHWAAEDKQKKARKQARAVMELLSSNEARPGTEDPEEGYRKMYEREVKRVSALQEELKTERESNARITQTALGLAKKIIELAAETEE